MTKKCFAATRVKIFFVTRISRNKSFFFFGLSVTDKLAPFKTKWAKSNSQEWFDGEVLESIALQDKLFKKFKHSKLNVAEEIRIDEEIYRIGWLKQNLENKLKENIALTKDLWKTLKSLGLSKKFSVVQTNATEGNNKKKTLWPLFMDGVQLPQGYSHFEEAVYFLPFSSQKVLVLILLTSEGWQAESTLELPSGFEHRTPGLGIQHLNH